VWPFYTQKDYDAITMGVENMAFSYGAKWQNRIGTVLGVVNSPEFIAALQYYKTCMIAARCPGLIIFYTETNDAMIGGQAAMIMNYVGFFPALANKATNPMRMSPATSPIQKGPGRSENKAPPSVVRP